MVDAHVLSGNPTDWSLMANHFVVVSSDIVFLANGNVSLSVFTWGKTKHIDMPVDDFLYYFYGYVAAMY